MAFHPRPQWHSACPRAVRPYPINSAEQYSQELRLASDFDGAINFMLGAFYEDRTFVFDTSQQGVNISFLGPDPVTGFTYDWDKIHTTKTEALSFFGSVMIDLTDKLELSGGVRWTDETKIQTISVPYLHTFLQGPGFVQPGFFSGPIRFADDNLSPEATLRYQANDDLNIFASFKTGFKSGGIDNSALPSNSLSQAALSGDFSSLIFDSESAIGGEAGFKSQWAGRSFTLNATAYYYVFKDLQVQNFNAETVQFATSNAGELTTKGVDLETRWIKAGGTGLEHFGQNLSYLRCRLYRCLSSKPLGDQPRLINSRWAAARLEPKRSRMVGQFRAADCDRPPSSCPNSLEEHVTCRGTSPIMEWFTSIRRGRRRSQRYFVQPRLLGRSILQRCEKTRATPDGKWKLSLIAHPTRHR